MAIKYNEINKYKIRDWNLYFTFLFFHCSKIKIIQMTILNQSTFFYGSKLKLLPVTLNPKVQKYFTISIQIDSRGQILAISKCIASNNVHAKVVSHNVKRKLEM